MLAQTGLVVLLLSCSLALPVQDGHAEHHDGPLPASVLSPHAGNSTDPNPAIIGGSDVDPVGKYPWQISLRYLGKHSCGGSVYDKKHIITAAHCVTRSSSFYTVIVGLHNQKYTSGPPGAPQEVAVEKITVHENYNSGTGSYPNDIAVLLLAEELTFNEYVQPIPIDENGNYGVDSECVISGWGYYTRVGFYWVMPDILQEVTTSVITNADCKSYWGERAINDGHVCILGPNADHSACMGDSGGPLHCRSSKDADWHLVGATSWGSSSCLTHMPGVYTRISYFKYWLLANL